MTGSLLNPVYRDGGATHQGTASRCPYELRGEMYQKDARYYDAIYSWKDYMAETMRLVAFIRTYAQRPANTLLDVACGTGGHLAHLRHHFEVEGIDIAPEMLNVAREKLTGVALHQGDMLDFDLGRTFDLVTCLFSSIGYVQTVERLNRAVANMARHVSPGGLLIIEPWFHPGDFRHGTLHSHYVDQPDLKIARMNFSTVEDGLAVMRFQYLVGTPEGIYHWEDLHRMGLFTHEEYKKAFEASGLEVHHETEGLMGRGLYIGRKT